MHDPTLAWRSEFPILESTTYLVSHSLGAMPRAAASQLTGFTEAWARRGVRAWAEGWWEMPLVLGDRVGRIIGAPAGSVVMQPNVSVCQALVLSCFDFRGRRNKIVIGELDFPSVRYVHEAHRLLGARVEVVPSDDGVSVPLERILSAIDEETLLVPASHVLFRSGYVQDLATLTQAAHAVGALVLADLYQSAGTVPVDVGAWDVDFATGGSVKWLCGGPGAGYLYVAPRLHDTLEPRLTGWAAHDQPFAFHSGPISYARGAARFQHGTPAIPALYAARAGYDIVSRIGVAEIRAKSVRQVQLALDLARELGIRTPVPERPEWRGGMVVLDVPGGEVVTHELMRREILVDHRPGAGIRISPHFYTTDDEIRFAFEELAAILEAQGASD
jgi:kynureninase